MARPRKNPRSTWGRGSRRQLPGDHVGEDVRRLREGLGPDVEKLAVPPLRQHRMIERINVLVGVMVARRASPVAELNLAEYRLHVGLHQGLTHSIAVGGQISGELCA